MIGQWLLAIADDLTGALEVGAHFAGSVVTTKCTISTRPEAPVLVIDTETRHLPAGEAAAIVRDAVRAARRFHPRLIYKKTDSTLRGNIAAELRALLQAMPGRSLVYAPAYPAMGRTVKGGRLFVAGVPVDETPFAADALNPVRTSDIAELLAGIPVIVLDGESDADLDAAARRITAQDPPPPHAAGPAALARALSACLQAERFVRPALPRVSRCLVINGSRHPASAAQIAFARAHGCFDSAWVHFDAVTAGDGLDRARYTGEQVCRMLAESSFDGIVVFGGDTAFGIHCALGSRDFHPYGEVVPGVPVSRCGDLVWITKAGGFGAPDILCDIRNKLT